MQQTAFNVSLGGLPSDASDDLVDQMWKISAEAQKIVERELELRISASLAEPGHTLALAVRGFPHPDEFRKNGAWSITVESGDDVPLGTLVELRDLIVSAYRHAAAKSGVSVTFQGAKAHVMRTTFEEFPVAFPPESTLDTEPSIPSKQLQEQFINFFVNLGELSVDAADSEEEAMYRIHQQAFAMVEREHRRLPSYWSTTEGPDPVQIAAYELCADEGLAEVFEDKRAWTISIVASSPVPGKALSELRDLILSAYGRAAADSETNVRFVHAEKHDVFRVTETSSIDFHQVESSAL